MGNNSINLDNVLYIIQTFNILEVFTILISLLALVVSLKTYSHSKYVAIKNNYFRERINSQTQFDKYRISLNKSIRKNKDIISEFNQLTNNNIARLSSIFSKYDNKNRLLDEHSHNKLGHLLLEVVDSIVNSQKEHYFQSPTFLYFHLGSIRHINKHNYNKNKDSFITNEHSIKIYEIIHALDIENLDEMHNELITLYDNISEFMNINNSQLKKAILKLENSQKENENDEFKLYENQELYFKYNSFLNQLKYIQELNTNIIKEKNQYNTQFLVIEIIYFCICIELIRRQSYNN